jgi:NTE family protein
MGRFLLPDVLVLGAGGTLGEAWMTGMLAGIRAEADVDFRRCEHFLGTSAGSIVAATLAAGREPRLPRAPGDLPDAVDDQSSRLTAAALAFAGRGAAIAAAPLVPFAMRATTPAAALVRAALLARAPGTRGDIDGMAARIDAMGARFDGRLRIATVEMRSGRRVVFGGPGAPPATVGHAVQASCAIPGVFRPVRIGERRYVDGGAWSPTNLDAAPAGRGTHVLCLTVTGRVDRGGGRVLTALQAFTRSALAIEELALRSRGAVTRVLAPDRAAVAAIGANLMDRSRAEQVLAAGYRQGVAAARRSATARA